MLKRIPPVFRNFYVVCGLAFLVWMTFLDSNDLISRFRMSSKLNHLEDEKAYYQERSRRSKKTEMN